MSTGTDWALPLSHYLGNIQTCVPQRVVLCLFGFLAVVHIYTMRYCLDMAFDQLASIQYNTSKIARTAASSMADRTRRPNKIREAPKATQLWKKPVKAMPLLAPAAGSEAPNWYNDQRIVFFVSFYIGYALTHVPGALLVEKYGGKWVLATTIALTAVLTLLTPTAIRMGGPIALVVIRFLIGMSEGPTFPALYALLAHWVPAKERGTLGVLVLSGGQIAVFLLSFLSRLLMDNHDWSFVFYFFGGSALMWLISFVFLGYNNPASNPFIKEEEKQYLEREIGRVESNYSTSTPTPWKNILTSAPMWALISATMQHDWSEVQQFVDISNVVKEIQKVTTTDRLNSSLPYLLKWLVSLLAGIVSDLLINRNILSTTATRRLMSSIVVLGPFAVMHFGGCFTCTEKPTDLRGIVNCAIGAMGTYYAGIILIPLDMSPNYASTIMAIANGMGSLSGILSPLLQVLSKKPFYKNFNELPAVLWLACTMLISGEVQPFDDPTSTVSVQQKTD